MKTYTRKELKEVLAQHTLWLSSNGANGARAILTGADLTGADLSGADLTGANLFGADLNGADLNGADLNGADLTGANLTGANLRDADLNEANLFGAILTGATLRRANLREADLNGADLNGANLREADLNGCIGDMRYVKSMQVERWPVTYTATHLQIGCQSHEIGQWWAFTDAEISRMYYGALEWWKKWEPLLQMIIEASPALLTGEDELI